jgi:hypothetical protein
MTFDKAAYLERTRQSVLIGIENQRRKIVRGEIRDPRIVRKPRKPTDTPTEYQEQKQVCEFLTTCRLAYFAVPNGGKRTAIEGNYLRYIGLKAGVPDLLILNAPPKHPTAKGVALEMKRLGATGPTDSQKAWLLTFSEQGWVSYCAFGATDAIGFLRSLGFGQ